MKMISKRFFKHSNYYLEFKTINIVGKYTFYEITFIFIEINDSSYLFPKKTYLCT